MSEKETYKEFNNIIIDEHEFDDIDVYMTDLQKIKLKHNLRKNIRTREFVKSKISAAIAAVLLILIGIGYTNPAFAAQFPILNPIVQMLGQTGNYASYSDIVNKTVTYNGKSFTINNVVCFDNNLIIGYTAKSNKKLNADALFFPIFKINGKWLNVGFSGGAKNLDGNTVMGTIEIMSNETILPGDFKFDMSFKEFDGTTGKWDFKFNISKAELSKNTKVYKSNQVITYNNHNFTLTTKVSLTPLSTVISLYSKQIFPSNWIVLDDTGNELSQGSGTSKEITGDYESITSYSNINKNTKYLTLIPYIEHVIDQSSKNISAIGPEDVAVPVDTKLPIELPQGKNSKVVLTKVSFSNDKDNVIIQGIIYGKLPNHQDIYLVGDNIKADISCSSPIIKKIDTDKYEFTKEYSKLKNDKNYRIITGNLDYNIDYNSRITVMLK